MKILVPLAEGFEEIEAITIIDVLRRASLDVVTACLADDPVTGSHNIAVRADRTLDGTDPSEFDALVLPGGMPGSEHLRSDKRIIDMVQYLHGEGRFVAAVCAAPIVLARAGVLSGKRATVFPGYEAELGDAVVTQDPVVHDGNIVTGKGAGCALPFALKLVELFANRELSDNLKGKLQVYWM